MKTAPWKNLVQWIGGAAAIFVVLFFVEKKQSQRLCEKIYVQIDNHFENHFIDEQDLLRQVRAAQAAPLLGVQSRAINLRNVEEHLKGHSFVRTAQVSRRLDGSLHVRVAQPRPIARLLHRQQEDQYLSEDGELLPLSPRYTARVMPVAGFLSASTSGTDSLAAPLQALLRYIYHDPFWRAQIAGIEMNHQGRLTLLPQVGRERIEFGTPEQFEQKFERLGVYYTRILPLKGWNHYERINVAFENQIICE